MNIRLAVVLMALAALLPALVSAQAVSGDLVGIVSDATGAGVPQTTVTATNDATGLKTTTVTDAGGSYRFANLPAGAYTLHASATGFSTATVKSVQVQLNNTVTQNMTLAVGSTSTTVEVTDAPPPLDTTTARL